MSGALVEVSPELVPGMEGRSLGLSGSMKPAPQLLIRVIEEGDTAKTCQLAWSRISSSWT